MGIEVYSFERNCWVLEGVVDKEREPYTFHHRSVGGSGDVKHLLYEARTDEFSTGIVSYVDTGLYPDLSFRQLLKEREAWQIEAYFTRGHPYIMLVCPIEEGSQMRTLKLAIGSTQKTPQFLPPVA